MYYDSFADPDGHQFEAETMNPEELQQAGWQAILDNFRRYTEKQGDLPYSHK